MTGPSVTVFDHCTVADVNRVVDRVNLEEAEDQMKLNWSQLLSALKTSPGLFVSFLGVIAKNPGFVTDLLAAEKSGSWIPFIETHTAVLLPLLDKIVTAMENDPTLTQEILSALVSGVAGATGAA